MPSQHLADFSKAVGSGPRMTGTELHLVAHTSRDGFGLLALNCVVAGVGSWTVCRETKTSCIRFFNLRDTWTCSMSVCFLLLRRLIPI